ncbi:MAG: TonB-dependent receptor [Caldithrix sp.]|nr:TonB-dependent receptor [Caldithrix sp.]
MNHLKSSIIFVLLPFVLSAASIKGIIVDNDKKPVADVYVEMINQSHTVISNDDGYFEIGNLQAGQYQLRLSHVAFQSRLLEGIAVHPHTSVHLDTIQLQPRIDALKATVVTATRTRNYLQNVAKSVNDVKRLEIASRQPKTTAEALREETGIFVQKTNHGGGSAIIRGLSSNQILLLVDGIRLNNSTYRLGNHQYLTTVDQNMVDRIEVIRGPHSVLYGSDALGGTINMITRQPRFNRSQWTWQANAYARFASVDNERTLRSQVSAHSPHLALQAGLSYKSFGDLRRGSNGSFVPSGDVIQAPSGFSARNMDGKLRCRLSEDDRLTIAYQLNNQQDVPRYDKYENDGYHEWYYDPQIRQLLYLSYERDILAGFIKDFNFTAAHHYQQEGRRYQKDPTTTRTKERHKVLTRSLSFQAKSRWYNHKINYGAEYYDDIVDSRRYSIDPATSTRKEAIRSRYPDGASYNHLGLFIHDSWNVNKRWMATIGGRYSTIFTDFNLPADSTAPLNINEVSQSYQSFTGSFSLMYKVNPVLHVYVNLSQGFRAPNLSDLSKFGESKGDNFEVPNPDLQPEKMIGMDWGGKLYTNIIRAEFTIYYSYIYDLLASDAYTLDGSTTLKKDGLVYQIKAKQNIGRAYITGIESFMNYQLTDDLSLRTNAAFAYGQNTTQNEPVGGLPPFFGLIGLKKQLSADVSLQGFTRFATEQNRLSADDKDDPRIPEGGTPGWYTVNIRLSWKVNAALTVRAALENILDYSYREHGSGINGPGRNAVISLKYQL